MLYVEVLRLKEIDKLVSSTEAACRELSEDTLWKEFMADNRLLDSNDIQTSETLRKNYYLAKQKYFKYCRVTMAAFCHPKYLNDRQGWIKLLESFLKEPEH